MAAMRAPNAQTRRLVAVLLLVLAVVCEAVAAARSFTDAAHVGGWLAMGLAFAIVAFAMVV